MPELKSRALMAVKQQQQQQSHTMHTSQNCSSPSLSQDGVLRRQNTLMAATILPPRAMRRPWLCLCLLRHQVLVLIPTATTSLT